MVSVEVTSKGRLNLHKFDEKWRTQPEGYLVRLGIKRSVDVFKVKAANRADPVYEGLDQAYEQLVSWQRRLGLYQLVCQD